MNVRLISTLAVIAIMSLHPAETRAQSLVTTGVVVKGVTVPGAGVPGHKVPGHTCDFSNEEVDQRGRMIGASVNCRSGGNTQNVLPGLPARFNAYCVVDVSTLSGARVMAVPVPGNANHCDLSGITPRNATAIFGGAIWR